MVARLVVLMAALTVVGASVAATGDLDVLVKGPEQVFPGTEVAEDIEVYAQNRSDHRIHQAEVQLLLSTGRTVRSVPLKPGGAFDGGRLLKNGTLSIELPPRTNRWLKLKGVLVPAEAKPGRYFLGATIRSVEPDKQRTAGTATSFMPIRVGDPMAPDLVASVRAPARVVAGNRVGPDFKVSLSNLGRRPAGPFDVVVVLSRDEKVPPRPKGESARFVADGVLPGGRAHVQGLGPGKHQMVPFPGVTVPRDTPGRRYGLFALVDVGDKVAERDETNNAHSQGITVVPDKPDLTGSVRLKGSSSVTAGEALFDRVRVEVRNDGVQPAKGPVTVELVLAKDLRVPIKPATYAPKYRENGLLQDGRATIGTLKPGESVVVAFKGANRIPAGAPRGTHRLTAVIDVRDTVDEASEENNAVACQVEVR